MGTIELVTTLITVYKLDYLPTSMLVLPSYDNHGRIVRFLVSLDVFDFLKYASDFLGSNIPHFKSSWVNFCAKSTALKLWVCGNIQALPHTYKKKEEKKSAPLFCWQPSYGEQFLLKKEPFQLPWVGLLHSNLYLFTFFHLLFALYLFTEVFCGLYSLWA